MKEHIQDPDWFYTFLRHFVDWSVRSSYRKYQVEGIENLPEEGSIVIWASNHTNALMDPMVMLPTTKIRKVFVARADIFKKNWARKALYFLRVMPIYRIRDGIDAVKHNNECIDQATGVILDGVPFIIFPEATHRAKHSLLKLSKGIFHIAENAIEKSDGRPVYIQPIGIEYSDYFRFRGKVLVRFGKPINVNKFLEEHPDEPTPVAMLQMRGLLTDALASQIVYIPDDEDYDAIWEYAKLKADNPEYFKKALAEIESRDGKKLKGLLRIQAVDKYAVAEALKLRKEEPGKARDIFAKVDALRVWRIQNGISVYSIAREPGAFKLLLKTLVALLGVPYYLFCALVGCLKWIPIVYILRGVKDDAFYNTARYGVRLALAIPALIIWSLVYFLVFKWYIALGLLLLSLPSLKYLYDYGTYFRRFISDLRWKLRKKHAPKL